MHEHGIVKSALDAAIATAERSGAHRITAMDVVVTDDSVSEDSIRTYLAVLGSGTVADGAQVRLRREPMTWVCWSCGASTLGHGRCEECGGTMVEPAKVVACRIESIEVEEGPPCA